MSSAPREEYGLFRTDSIKLSGFEVSYVGEGPSQDMLCFGSDEGQLVLESMKGHVRQGPFVGSESREAINGVAFIGQHIAVSTRNELTLFTVQPNAPRQAKRVVVPAGAHGVTAAPSGQFVAPLGTPGVLFIAPSEGEEQRIRISRPKDREFYFYRVAALAPSEGPEVLVCATRGGGLTSILASGHGERRMFTWMTFPGLDAVDVCALGTGLREPAACVVAKDCSLVMSRNVLRDRRPATLRFDGVKGIAYRVFAARGHLFLLTSEGMYVFYTLVSRFLAGEPVEGVRTSVREFPAEAVDASIVFDRYLFLVMPDEVLRFDLNPLSAAGGQPPSLNGARDIEPVYLSPEWTSEDLEEALVTVG